MVRCSNKLVFFTNLLALLVAFPVMSGGLFMRKSALQECQQIIPWSIILIGASLLILSVIGMLGTCCRIDIFMVVYVIFMFLLVISAFTSSAVSIIASVHRSTISHDSTSLIKRAVLKDWSETETCLKETQICKSLVGGNQTGSEEEFLEHLTMIQSACCTPPKECGFRFVNATYWEGPEGSKGGEGGDCGSWKNGADDGMCNECEKCKAGFLKDARITLGITGVVDGLLMAFLVFLFVTACCALANSRTRKYEQF